MESSVNDKAIEAAAKAWIKSYADYHALDKPVEVASADIGHMKKAFQAYQASQWQDIESAPKDGTFILLGHAYGENNQWWNCCSNYWDEDGYWSEYVHMTSEPTHWMPLPALPSPPQDKEEV